MSDEFSTDQPIKRGPGRPPKVRTEEPEFEGEDITYLPGEGDPHYTKWRGIEFKANIATRVKDKSMIEAARGNRFFRVGSDQNGEANPNEAPKTAMQYRAHVLDWMKSVSSVEDLIVHWSDDRMLRQSCEVGADDVAYLGTLIEPKLRDMRLAAGMSDQDVANIWIKHGVLDLPWRT